MEFLVEKRSQLTESLAKEKAEALRTAESAAATALTVEGHLRRLWRSPRVDAGITVGDDLAVRQGRPDDHSLTSPASTREG